MSEPEAGAPSFILQPDNTSAMLGLHTSLLQESMSTCAAVQLGLRFAYGCVESATDFAQRFWQPPQESCLSSHARVGRK